MKNELAKIDVDLLKRKKELNTLSKKYIYIIYQNILKGKTFKQIHKELTIFTTHYQKEHFAVSKTLFKNALAITKKSRKQYIGGMIEFNKNYKGRENKDQLFDLLVLVPLLSNKGLDVLNVLTSIKQGLAQENVIFETKRKKEILNNLFSKTLEEKYKTDELDKKIFFLASTHEDCAKDHLSSQGKMYVSKNWKKLITSNTLKKQIEHYIKSNGVLTLEEIIDKPVYFIMRPNCRHYVKEIKLKDALSVSVDELLVKYDLKSKVGERGSNQTLGKNKGTLEAYQERLEVHTKLNTIYKSNKLDCYITKDKIIIEKLKQRL